jgi:acetyl-CoA carboxylase carboxyltransferase component
MGVEGAVNIIFRDQLARAEDRVAELERLTLEYEERFANPYVAAGRGYLDDVIVPSETRPRVIAAFEMLEGKRDEMPRRKHGNIPL